MVPLRFLTILLASLFGVGILLSGLLPLTGWTAFVLYLTTLVPLLLAVVFCRQHQFFSAFGMLCVLCLGMLMGYLQRSRETRQWSDSPQIYSGVITSQPRRTEKSISVRARLAQGTEVQLFLRPAKDSLYVGEGIDFAARLRQPYNFSDSLDFDYASYLRHQGVSGMAYVRYWKPRTVGISLPWTERIRIRALHLSDRADSAIRGMGLEEDFSSLLSAMLLGRKAQLSSDTRNLYQQMGASHILALSGLHLSIFMGLLLWLLLRVLARPGWRWTFGLLGIFMIWSYALLTGFSPSLVRASVMTSLFILSLLLGRSRSAWYTLGLAALVMLFVSPRTIYDAGFQLSFVAMAGLLAYEPLLARLWHPQNLFVAGVWSLLRVSVAAQLATMPLVIYYFHQYPVYGAFLGILFAFLASWLVWLALATLVLHVLGFDILVPLLNLFLKIQHALMQWLAHLPGNMVSDLHLSVLQTVFIYVSLISLALAGYRSRSLNSCGPYLIVASLALLAFSLALRFGF